jgi:hypothetical protein
MRLRERILILLLLGLSCTRLISAEEDNVHPALSNVAADAQVSIIIEFFEGVYYAPDEFSAYGCETGTILTALYGLATVCPAS